MSALATELAKPEYSQLSDQAAADAINALTVSRARLVPIWEVKQLAIISGYWPVIVAGQMDADAQKAGLCLSVTAWVDDPKIQTIDVNLPAVQTMLSGLVAFSVITQEQANAIIALGTETIPWTQANGLPEVGIGFVINARKELNAE